MEGLIMLLMTFTCILSLISEGLAVKCYICSYSPEDQNNRTDICTDDNFRPQNVYTHECPLGCETFVQWDANEDLEQWRRNCVQDKNTLTSECKLDNNVGWKNQRCTCTTDFCNSALSRTPSTLLTPTALSLLAAAVTASLWRQRTTRSC